MTKFGFLGVALSCLLVVSGCGEKSVKEYMSNAQSAVAQGDIDTAIIQLKNVLKLEPENAEARFLIGKMYTQSGDWEFAQKELEKALEFQYPANEVVPLIADVYRKMGEDNKLLKLDLRAKGITVEQLIEIKYFQARAYFRSELPEKAQALIDEIKVIRSDSVYKSLTTYLEFKIAAQQEAAWLQLQEVYKTAPNEPEVILLMAQESFIQKDIKAATDYFAQYRKAAPTDHPRHFMLAQLYVDQRRYAEAEPVIDDLLKLNAKQPYLNQLKALVLFHRQDFEAAFNYAEVAVDGAPEDNVNRLIAGTSAYAIKNYESAFQHLSLIASVLPDDHKALRLLANSQLQLGHVMDANETVARFVALDEQDAVLLSSIAGNLSLAGERQKAAELIAKNEGVELQGQSLTQLGVVKLSLDDASGILDLENALNVDGEVQSRTEIERILVNAYLSTKKYDQALAIAQKWLAQPETAFESHMLAGLIYHRQNKPGMAMTEYQLAQRLKPNDPTVAMAQLDLMPTTSEAELKLYLNGIDALLAQHPDFVPAILKQYVVSKMLQLPNRMISHLESRIAQPQSQQVLSEILGKIYVMEDLPEKAIPLFEGLKTEKPKMFWQSLANAYATTGRFEKAVALFREWSEKAPNSAAAIFGMARVFHVRGEVAEGLKLTTRYKEELGGKDDKIDLFHIQLLIDSKKFGEAKKDYLALPSELKMRPYAAGLLGQMQLQDNDLSLAIENLLTAYKARPNAKNATYVARALAKNKQTEQARSFLAEHTANTPNDQTNLMYLASMQLTKQPQEAIATYRKAIQLNRKNFIALNNLAYLLLEQGQLDEAGAFAEEALVLQPDNRNVMDTLASIAIKNNQLDRAETLLSKAMESGNGKVEESILINYVEVLLMNNKSRLAQRQIERHKIIDPIQKERLQKLKTKYNI